MNVTLETIANGAPCHQNAWMQKRLNVLAILLVILEENIAAAVGLMNARELFYLADALLENALSALLGRLALIINVFNYRYSALLHGLAQIGLIAQHRVKGQGFVRIAIIAIVQQIGLL